MRIVVFSGTTEGRDFSRAAATLGIAVTVSVATDLGAEEQGQAPGITVHSGRLLPGAMAELLQGAALCVDACCAPPAPCPRAVWCWAVPPRPRSI